MSTKFILLSIIAVFLSFIGGFWLANSLNRAEINALRTENDGLKSVQKNELQNQSDLNLSDEEITRKIAEADQNPANITFQKNLGLALYRYAALKQNTELLSEVSRLLTRVNENNPQDFDVLVALGNIHFDIGYFKKENGNLRKGRQFYLKALEQKPEDGNVRTDLALTYFLEDPPDNESAIAEFRKALMTNPKDERTLQFFIQALAKEKKTEEAEQSLAKLREINRNNQALSDLEQLISQSKRESAK